MKSLILVEKHPRSFRRNSSTLQRNEMVRNEEHCKAILIENLYCQKGYGVTKLMKEFLAKTWKKTALYIS